MKIFKRQADYADRSVKYKPNRSEIDSFNELVVQQTFERYINQNEYDFEIIQYIDTNLVNNHYNKVDWQIIKRNLEWIDVIGYAESKTRQNWRFPLYLSMSKAAALLDQRAKHVDDNMRLLFIWGLCGTENNDAIFYLNLWSPKLKNNRYDLSKCNLVWAGTSQKVKSNCDQEWCFEIPFKDLTHIDESYYVEID
jgi:hypothetical protein